MDRRKQLFTKWAPQQGAVWTKFAKPALFMHTDDAQAKQLNEAIIPGYIQQLDKNRTAIIVDFPGAKGIETGIGLAKNGFRPVPLYNGIHETKTGGLQSVVDNSAIIDALVSGSGILRYARLNDNAPPAFLLDSNRGKVTLGAENMYDNRWSVDLDDMPSAAYMKEQGITQIILWSDKINDDLKPIINSYQDAGIIFITYINGQKNAHPHILFDERSDENYAVRNFKNARFGLLLVVIMAIVNLFGMFAVNNEPLLWTAPTIMWLTYLWLSEGIGDVIAIAMVIFYVVLFVLSSRKRYLMSVAFVVFAIEVAVLFVYAGYYGFAAYTGYSFEYGALVFIPPLVVLFFLAKGAYPDSTLGSRFYRGSNYRGYRGYGGGGYGGYGGGRYSGYGGGFGG